MGGTSGAYDVIIAGGGPAGAACAAFCAQAGLATLVLERSVFPRDKVCGDCLNPGCWDVLDQLGVTERVLGEPHAKLARIEFAGMDGRHVRFAFMESDRGEIAIKRSLFDDVLLRRAIECGAEVRQGTAVTAVERSWHVTAGDEVFRSAILVAADGRNSTVARLAGLLKVSGPERVSVQTHLPLPAGYERRLMLRFLAKGYCGMNDVGGGEFNLCMVGPATQTAELKRWAAASFNVPEGQVWRTIAPLSRRALPCAPGDGLLLVGDAARVVEPFTGEGIYYALTSGELAAREIIRRASSGEEDRSFPAYKRAHARLYAGRLWINRLARQAVLRPRLGAHLLRLLAWEPRVLRFLTQKVVGADLVDTANCHPD